MITTVPELMALAHGIACRGDHRCYYCGAPCDGSHGVAEHVKPSFTGRDGAFAPGSPGVCAGCVLCLRDEATILLINGESRHMTRIAMRGWSWVVTADRALAASKAHLAELRAVLLSPPDPPWAVVLSDSGQKQLLYRGCVNRGGDACEVTLETERIRYRLAALAGRIALCTRLVAATGKPALAAPVDHRFATAVMARYADGESMVAEWCRVASEPLSRLAAWLSPKKEDACLEYPADAPAPDPDTRHRGPAPQAGRADRPEPQAGGGRAVGNPGSRQPMLFDPGAPVRGGA